jgi:4-hydroxy-4-methyl-2-oxoglutarate aldolase
MYLLNPLPPAVGQDALDLLKQAEPATIGHFLHTGFMSSAIGAHFQDVRIAGTAVTVRAPGMDGAIVHYALGQIRRGDILVIDRCGESTIACLGGATAYAAKQAGVAGIIVDGLVTDLGELREHGVPIWSRGSCAITTKSLGLGGEFCIPITCGGVAVNPGDAILADENGVLVLNPKDIREAASRAIQMQKDEKLTLARLKAGEKLPDIVGSTAVVMNNVKKAA